ncbi:hypothetical protein EDD37DRAFT_644300 [Exophiala viscosa]|uniref:Rhodopsin domain-containing protein n=1 Tax=Exophiala viscosa TaxID=2486360 RepID=A0AAN6I8N0_9EURO|nr:hypothetical protein EDD36DRAFT_110790 [Exophiala viscosa]KAI1628506.1 hypothetical protein EDD37DRAFT_644300 [Exophiala viscosa]
MLVSSQEARVTGWVCAGLALVILIVRVIAARLRRGSFDISTPICTTAILIIAARVAVNQFVLSYGTSNDTINGKGQYFDSDDLEKIKVGSILSLIARLMVTTVYWLQSALLLLFYCRIFEVRAQSTTALIRICWVALPTTYIAVVLATFLECHPFSLYWQIDPNPGKCIKAYIQLLTQGIANIVLDLLLLIISCPLILVRNRTILEKIRLATLFCLGFFCIIVTCVRIAYIYAEDSYQPVRSFWASVQMLVSCFVANAPTIYGSLQLIRRRKTEQTTRRGSRPELWLHLHTADDSTAIPIAPVLDRQGTGSSHKPEKTWSRWIP